MTIPSSAPASASRAALAKRLTDLRKATGLSGNAFAKRMGVVQSRVWKIEHPDKPPHLVPNDDDITAWAEAAGASPETAAELARMAAEARAEQAFSAVYRTKEGPGAYQDRIRAVEEQSQRIGEFEMAVVPGLLQTADYARELVTLPGGLKAWGTSEAGIAAQVAGKLRRQEILHAPGKRIQMVLGEAALRTRVVTPETLAGQLAKLLSVLQLPAVELGVISFGQHVPAYTLGGFRVHDDDLIIVESIAGERWFTAEGDPDEVAAFLEAFEALRRAAVTGEEARRLITAAAEALREKG